MSNRPFWENSIGNGFWESAGGHESPSSFEAWIAHSTFPIEKGWVRVKLSLMRIAVVQCFNILDDARLAGDAIVERLLWAEEEGIDLTLFPESFLLGHTYDPETIRSRASVAASAIPALCERVAAIRSTLVVGAFDLADGQVFNSAIIIEAGRVVGRYSKAHPNEPGVTAGSEFPTFLRSGVRYGVNICNDANHPGPAQRIADQDARLILYPLNNMLRSETADRWREKSLAKPDRPRPPNRLLGGIGRRDRHVGESCELWMHRHRDAGGQRCRPRARVAGGRDGL